MLITAVSSIAITSFFFLPNASVAIEKYYKRGLGKQKDKVGYCTIAIKIFTKD